MLLHDSECRMCELTKKLTNPMATVIAPTSYLSMPIFIPCVCLQTTFNSQFIPGQPAVCLQTGMHVVSDVTALAIGVHWDARLDAVVTIHRGFQAAPKVIYVCFNVVRVWHPTHGLM